MLQRITTVFSRSLWISRSRSIAWTISASRTCSTLIASFKPHAPVSVFGVSVLAPGKHYASTDTSDTFSHGLAPEQSFGQRHASVFDPS